MPSAVPPLLAMPLVVLLLFFCVRRVVLLVAALAIPRDAAPVPPAALPGLTILVPAHDECTIVPRLLSSLDAVEYPRDRFSIVLISDGSSDGTAAVFERWAQGRPWARVLVLESRLGKARALNQARDLCRTDVVAVCDADLELRPETFCRLAAAFGDPSLGAAAAMLHPANAGESAVAAYAAVESWVHQLITSAGKDRLDMNPPTFGAAAYRRAALEQVGWFPPVADGEDVAVTTALTRAGWRTRFIATAVVDNRVASTLHEYWQQHIRWFRGSLQLPFHDVSRRVVSLGRRFELGMLTASYSDRLVFVAAAAFASINRAAFVLAGAYVGIRALEIFAAVVKAGAGRHAPAYLLSAAVFFLLDVAASAAAVALHLAHRPRRWTRVAERP